MCLDIVTSLDCDPGERRGWKIAEGHVGGTVRGPLVGKAYPANTWVDEADAASYEIRLIGFDDKQPYPRGFHVFRDLAAARVYMDTLLCTRNIVSQFMPLQLVSVRYRNTLAEGRQGGVAVDVAREIFVELPENSACA